MTKLKLNLKTDHCSTLFFSRKTKMAFKNHLLLFFLLLSTVVTSFGKTMTSPIITPLDNKHSVVSIEDLVIAPVCVAPADASITCAELEAQLESFDVNSIEQYYATDPEAALELLNTMFGSASEEENSTADTIVELDPSFNFNDCGWGSMQRQFETWQWGPGGDVNSNGQLDREEAIVSENSCTQQIAITEAHQYRIHFPADISATSIDDIDFDSQLEIIEEGCDIISFNVGDAESIGFTGDLCFKFAVTYDIINWCVWDGENDGYTVNREEGVQNDPNSNYVVDHTNQPTLWGNTDGIAVDYTQAEDPGNLSFACDDNLCGRWNYTQYIRVYDPISPCGEAVQPCPVMFAYIASDQIRPCLEGDYQILYCNAGGENAEDASIEITIDPALIVTTSIPAWTTQDGNIYTFELGDLPSFECGNIQINFIAPCDDPAGTTYCSEVYAYPDIDCTTIDPEWDGSEIKLSIECLEDGDSLQFMIENVGVGNMASVQEYIIIEDNVLLYEIPPTYQLDAGEMMPIVLPANGFHYYMKSEQAAGFPGQGTPVSWIEGCGTSMNLNQGAINQYALGDEDSWHDVFCLESVNSFDPNDKTGFPRGIGQQHFIDQNQSLEYLIRFQNTGTAEALYIEIRDTIATDRLDLSTIRVGASSHPYTWQIEENSIVVFRFENINLPSEDMDEEGSNGFVQFRIQQHYDLPIGSQIENTAAIYFDNNAPIITNETVHTIGEDYLATWIKEIPVKQLDEVLVFPNPVSTQVYIEIKDMMIEEPLHLKLYDVLGNHLMTVPFKNKTTPIVLEQYPIGTYFFKVYKTSQLIGVGKIMKI